MLNCDAGMFYKRRDLSIIVDNKNPIVAHEYLGKDLTGKDVIVVDDMVSSGGSMLEVIDELVKRKVNKVFVFCTFAFFDKGIKDFEDAYKKGKLTRFYTSNLSYNSEELKKSEWFRAADCSAFVANIIDTLYNEQPLTPLLNGKQAVAKVIKKHIKKLNPFVGYVSTIKDKVGDNIRKTIKGKVSVK
jgi:ribose-phosphate pyrophosphokinase